MLCLRVFAWTVCLLYSFHFAVSQPDTRPKMKFSIKHVFNKCDQIRRKSLMENFILCAVWISMFAYTFVFVSNVLYLTSDWDFGYDILWTHKILLYFQYLVYRTKEVLRYALLGYHFMVRLLSFTEYSNKLATSRLK